MRGGLIVAILSLVFLVPAQALAQYCKTPCELDASGDSYLEADSGGDDNFGALRVLEVRRWTAAFRRRAVLRFDLSTIPPDATINTASVLLTIRANNLSSGSRDFNLHKIDSDRPWVETEVTWDDYIDSTPWTSGGGDYAGTASVSLELKASPPPHSAGQQTWSSPQLATDAQGFLSSPSTNQGWLLKQENDHQGAGQEVTFHSREATTPYDDDDKPKLTLTYTMTESAVDLISLSAARTPHGNEIHWRTGLEVDNVGFHIYRDVDGKRVRITQALITGSTFQVTPATTPTAAHSYTWLAPEEPDGDLGADDETKYWLQDIDLNGKSKWHGPVTPTPSNASSAIVRDGAAGSSPARTARGGQQRIASHAPLRHPAATPSVLSSSEARRIRGSNSRVWDIPGADSIKLIVDRDGWYRVDSALLFAAGLASHVDPRNLQLWAGGEEQPIRVFGEGDGRFDPTDSIEFQGRALDTRFTNSQTYWLVAGRENGRRFSSTALT